MKQFTYKSAFAGIGGMTMGLKDLGGICTTAWEYDPTTKVQYAANAHKLLHHEVPVEGDICQVDVKKLDDFDLFCFTPPCQSFSVAGNRGGFADTRGTLTFEALRIARHKQPKVLFMENVKGLVNHNKGNTLGTILHAINEIGYTVDFTVLNSKYFDVAQNRERVYLVAVRNDLVEHEEWINKEGKTMLPKARKKYSDEGLRTFNFEWPEQLEVRTKLKDFLESEVDEKYYMSEDKTALLISQIENGVSVKEATKKGYSLAEEGDSINIAFPTSTTRRGRVGKEIANTLEASNINQAVIEKVNSPKMLGLLNMLGTDQVRRVYSTEGLSPTLTTMQGGHQEPKIAENECNKYAIRKLTPRECLRLQSVDEKYIDIILDNFSDSKAYKFAGNGLTTNVIKAIGEKLLKYL